MLLTRIRDIHQKNRGVYGSPRVYKALKKEGVAVGKKRVERLMCEHDLKGRVVRVTRRQPGLKRFIARGENLKLNKSDATDVNQVWVSDITFIKVKDVYKHLIVIMDIYSRKILGWSLSHTRTSEDTVTVLKRVIRERSPSEDMIFHTDRGIEFTGQQFRKELQKHGIRPSVNRLGKCTDNGHMESFFHSLKAELIRGRVFRTMNDLRAALNGYINQFYNRKRMHSGIGYLSPIEYEERVVQ